MTAVDYTVLGGWRQNFVKCVIFPHFWLTCIVAYLTLKMGSYHTKCVQLGRSVIRTTTAPCLCSNPTFCLSYTDNIMFVDALATLRTRASAGMVLAPKAGIIRLKHQKSQAQVHMDQQELNPSGATPFYWHGLTLIPAWMSNHIH